MKKPDWEQVESNQQKFLLKEIEVIHNQISKCDEFSLVVKGWAITLWSALFLFAISQSTNYLKVCILWFSIVVLVAFWIMDAYFKYFQRASIARSNLISDYLNGKTPENSNDFIFRIYDPVGRISKERNIIKVEKKGKTVDKKEKRKNNYYWKNYIGNLRFLRAIIVRVVSSLYCFLIGFTLFILNIITSNLCYTIFTIAIFGLGAVFFILSHLELV